MAGAEPAVEPEPWGDDPKLVEVLGERGAAQFRALFDGFPDLVGVLWAKRDGRGRIVDFTFGYGNPAILRAFRLPPAMRDRYTLLEALPPMRGSRAFDAYVRVCESGEPWVHEVTYDTPFGDGYMLGTFVERSARLGDGLVNFLTDVTAQRRMEAELRSYADVVAHDLSEPIAGIALLVRMLEQRAGEPPPEDVLRQLRASTDRARDLIDGVLVYARAGELSTKRIALRDLVAEVAEDLRPGLEQAGATLVVGDLPEVDGDPRQLRRVLQNLVGNALKFRGEAPPRVEVTAVRDSQEWVVTVRDNGIGVDPRQASRIFGMFSRANTDTGGAGIGLAVCRRIVEAHGGRIWVESGGGGRVDALVVGARRVDALVVGAEGVDAVVVGGALDVLAVHDDVVVVDQRGVVAGAAVDDVAAVLAAAVPGVEAVVAGCAVEAVVAAVVGEDVVAAAAVEAVVARAAAQDVVAAAAADGVVARAAGRAVVAGLQRDVVGARGPGDVVVGAAPGGERRAGEGQHHQSDNAGDDESGP